MPSKNLPNYLAGYAPQLAEKVRQLIKEDTLADYLLSKYPNPHGIRTDIALYQYVQKIKAKYLRNEVQLSKVQFDTKLHVVQRALGMHTRISRAQGARLKIKREIRIAAIFKDMPIDFLRMIVVHELAHMKEVGHNKAFYQLCVHMEPRYVQLEFDVRAYLTHLDVTGRRLWN